MLPVNPERLPVLMQEAQQHQAAGRYIQARNVLETILATKEDIAVAHFNLAKVLLKLDEPDLALQHLDRAADLKPDEAVVWRQYATTLQWLAEPARSNAFLEKAKRARIDRTLLMSLQDMLNAKPKKSKTSIGTASPADVQRAIGFLNAGQFEQAAKLAAQLDRAHPNVAILVDLLAYAQAELGQAEEAERNFRRAIKIDPKYPEARANFGQFLLRQERYDEAIDAVKDALRLMPDMPVALATLGTALTRRFRYAQAIRFLKRALVLDPEQVPARIELAECLLSEFNPEEAIEVLSPILHLEMINAKNRVLYARALMDLQRVDEAEEEFDKALAVAQRKTLALTGKASAMQTAGRFDEAEALLREALGIEPLLGEIYGQLLNTKKLEPGDPLIEQMEKAYSDPAITPESRMYVGFALAKAFEDTKAYDRVFEYLRPANDEMRQLQPYDIGEHLKSTRFVLDLFRDADFSTPIAGHSDFAPIYVTGLPRSGTTLVEQIISSHSAVTGGGELNHTLEALNNLTVDLEKRGHTTFDIPESQLAEIGTAIEARMRGAFPEADRITDKGLGSYEMIGPIRAIFPNSRIIVVRRDPRDTLLSMYKNVFQHGRHLYTNSLKDLATYYHSYVEVIDFWREKIPGAFYEIEYEALIADPETQARNLIAACDLDWEDQCLAFHENKRRVQTLSVHQVRQPLYASSMKAWQRYEADLGELFEALGEPWLPDSKASAG